MNLQTLCKERVPSQFARGVYGNAKKGRPDELRAKVEVLRAQQRHGIGRALAKSRQSAVPA